MEQDGKLLRHKPYYTMADGSIIVFEKVSGLVPNNRIVVMSNADDLITFDTGNEADYDDFEREYLAWLENKQLRSETIIDSLTVIEGYLDAINDYCNMKKRGEV